MIQKEHVITDREFTVLTSAEVARNRVSEYLEGAGYRQTSAEPLTYERGSKLGTPFAFTPKKWHSVVTIGVNTVGEGASVKATFDVDKTGQLISAREALYWENTALQRTRSAPLRSPLSFETLGDFGL